jgi:hypothetical protein
MYHQRLSQGEVSSLLGNCKWQSTIYPDYPTFNQALQHANNAPSGFWRDLCQTPYAYKDMNDNVSKIRDQFEAKLRNDINSHIKLGQIGQKFAVLIAPGAANSNYHVYIFFPTEDSEINAELKSTFSI